MRRDVTPEERLLGLIKDKKKTLEDTASAIPSSPVPPVAPKREINRFSISDIFREAFFKKGLSKPETLRVINRYLTAALLILLAYLVFDSLFIKPYKNIQSIVSQAPETRASERAAEAPSQEVKDYSYYSKEMSDKGIFGPPSMEAGKGAQLGVDSGDISKDLTLVGIIAGENPQAIIEDKKSQKTYYLSRNQSFNGFTVEDISDGKVVLDYGGRKISLFL